MSSEQPSEASTWPRAALSTHTGQADSDAAPVEDVVPAQCKYPGCRRPRQVRVNRRGAPPAYCDDPGHEPDAARRERRRRLRAALPTNANLDEHDHPQGHPDYPHEHELEEHDPLSVSPELPQPRKALEPGTVMTLNGVPRSC